MYRFHPQMAEAKRRVAAGEIGPHFAHPFQPIRQEREPNNRASGAMPVAARLMDIGCYA